MGLRLSCYTVFDPPFPFEDETRNPAHAGFLLYFKQSPIVTMLKRGCYCYKWEEDPSGSEAASRSRASSFVTCYYSHKSEGSTIVFDKITFGGNIGEDSELIYTGSGEAANMAIAAKLHLTYHNGSGENMLDTTWYKLSVWGKDAEAVKQHLRKGSHVEVEGEIVLKEDCVTKSDGTLGGYPDNSTPINGIKIQDVRFFSVPDDAGAAETKTVNAPAIRVPFLEIPF